MTEELIWLAYLEFRQDRVVTLGDFIALVTYMEGKGKDLELDVDGKYKFKDKGA